MVPWGRSVSSSSITSAGSGHVAESAEAGHHRRSSSNLQSAHTSAASSSTTARHGRFSSRNKVRDNQRQAEEVAIDDDPWEEGSDDEATVAALTNAHKLSSLNISTNSVSDAQSRLVTPTQSSAATSPTSPAAASPSSWSFNPFSIISGSSKSSPVRQASLSGAEAVAAALSGQQVATMPVIAKEAVLPSDPRPETVPRNTSYLASASKVQAEADELVEEEERAKGNSRDDLRGAAETDDTPSTGRLSEDHGSAHGPTHRRQSSRPQLEHWQSRIKPNVEDLVKDPVSLLARLAVVPPSIPSDESPAVSTVNAVDARAHRASISSIGRDALDPEDEDPAAGYVQLDATNISSGGPQIVDYSKEDGPPEETAEQGREKRRRKRFFDCLGAPNVDLSELRSLAWSGIPCDLRPIAWQLLLGYLPAPSTRRLATLARKRQEYADAVRLAFSRGVKGLDGPIWHQISIDVPRTHASVRLWQCEGTQRSLERILYVWAIRHPASGYVQGINDLATPFFQVFLSSYIDSDPEEYDVSALPPSVLEALEADSFWCLSKLLDGIQDNYIFAQPGITRQVARMKELCARVDAPLANHLENNGVEFIQFAFRWMNCLLMREMSVKNIVRMWDTYLAEGGDAFSEFHLYVCLAFLVKWSDQLREMDFQNIIIFLQSLPTQSWTDKNIELLLSEAFMWSRTFVAR